MPQYTQDDRLLRVHTTLGDDVLLLDHFQGNEALSAPFRFSLRLFAEKEDQKLKDLMGQLVTIRIGTFSPDPRYFNGHVIYFAHAGSDGGFTFYDMQLGPWLEFLRRRQNCRIFQGLKVEEILKKVFADYGALAVHDIRATSKEPLTMCVQYNETDFQFISRLLEAQGWFYYFDHEDGKHTMVVDDDSPSLAPNPLQPEVEFNDSPGSDAEDAIDRFESFRNLVPNKLALKTFDFKNPKDPLMVKTDTQHQMGKLPDMEWYEHHGPYTYKEFEEGDDLAKLHLEHAEARSKGFQGAGNCRALATGYTFKFFHHYLYEDEFLVVSAEHSGSNNYFERGPHRPYRNTFTAMRKAVAFRPPKVTPRPEMRGPQSATVVCPNGEEIDCDPFGRIKVQFHWDRHGQFNEQSSCWVRLAMPWAGSNFGFITIPRKDQEVLVDFLEGDPDLPIVVGSIYNQDNKPPWDLPENKTQSGILTRSSKNGTPKNANALRFEDKKDHEQVWLHAERNQLNDIEVDETHIVGHDRTTTIQHDETTTVKKGNRKTDIETGTDTLTVKGNRSTTVTTGSDSLTVSASSHTTTVATTYTINATGACSFNLHAGVTFSVTGSYYANTSAEYHVHAPEFWAITDSKVHLKAGGSEIFVFPDRIELKAGGSTLKVDAAGIHLSGPMIEGNASGLITWSGSMVKLNC